ncbi:MAG: hypothetical protein QM775_12370 [Pirellulales bacterium]
MVDMIRAMHDKVEVYGLVNDSAQRQKVVSMLEQHGLPANAVVFAEIPLTACGSATSAQSSCATSSAA